MRRKMKGKALVILMALAMIFTVMPMMAAVVHADSTEVVVDHIKYTLTDDGTAEVSGYDENLPAEVTIPAAVEISGMAYAVTGIGEGVFNGSGLEDIIFESGSNLESIERQAFFMCKSLKTITIPEGVTSIGEWAFSESGLGDIVFESGSNLKSIGNGAFAECENLKAITIPEGVTSIEDDAFFGCKSLTTVTIPNGVTSIGDHAFAECENLKAITIPESVTSIGLQVFGFSGLKSITFENESNLKSIGDWAFETCKSLKTITIPRKVTKIGEGAFKGCKALETLYFRGTEPEWNRMPGRSSKWSGDQKIKVVCLIKAANPLKVKARTVTVKYSRLKKQDQTLAVNKVIRFTKKGKGRMTYIKASGSKKITISKRTGKVTVRKGLKKGTYRIKVKVKAAGNVNYKASAWKTVTFRVRVK